MFLNTPTDEIKVSVRGAVSKPTVCTKRFALTVSLRNIKPWSSYYAKVICIHTHVTLYSVSDRAEWTRATLNERTCQRFKTAAQDFNPGFLHRQNYGLSILPLHFMGISWCTINYLCLLTRLLHSTLAISMFNVTSFCIKQNCSHMFLSLEGDASFIVSLRLRLLFGFVLQARLVKM